MIDSPLSFDTMTIQDGHRQIFPTISLGNKLANCDRQTQKLITLQITSWVGLTGSIIGWHLLQASPAKAQVTSDGTVGTQVNTVDNVTEIGGGTQANSNLFHSFQDFSLETGDTAFFNNAPEVNNIIGRVTGGNISNIDGLIKANGNANLVLINPRGINFGANAQLDIGGSFLGSTADQILFADGTAFSATDTQVEPMLTVSVPVGLQLGQNSGKINVTGNGHDLRVADPLFSPIIFGEQLGLRVKSNQTLALVGAGITLDGGTIAATGGRIELGSVADGFVDLDFDSSSLSLGYENITAWDNIQLRSQALVDVSGTTVISGGSIQVQGKQLALDSGSLFLVQNLAEQGAGDINISTSESVTVSGTSPDSTIRSSLTNETLGLGEGGGVKISTGQLTVDNGATIVAKTLFPGIATGGNLEIAASESIQVIGASSINPTVTSSIVAASFGAGNGGNNNITTNSLSARAGGTIAATAFNTGSGGDISITANSIELVGIEPNVFAPTAITASTFGSGNAGNLTIDTATLSLFSGGRVDASTAAIGNAGSLAITATDSITISGTVPGSLNPSLIIASANVLDPAFRSVFRLPDIPSGDSGNVTITTSQLEINAGGQLTVRNDGTGNAGILKVVADEISVSNEGGISAVANQSGVGGNLNLSADNIFLDDNSFVSAQAIGQGNGGNIMIGTDNLVLLDSSNLIANANEGTGGNIEIDTQGLFICNTCQITVSSRLGVDGVIDINTLQPNSQFELLDLPQQPTQIKETVVVACPSNSGDSISKLTITGRGGLPRRPQETLSSESIIPFESADSQSKESSKPTDNHISLLPPPAQSWYRDNDGTVILSARPAATAIDNSPQTSLDCSLN